MAEVQQVFHEQQDLQATQKTASKPRFLQKIKIPQIPKPDALDARNAFHQEALPMTEEEKRFDGEKAYKELQEKGYFVGINSTVEGMLTHLADERPYDTWLKDERTAQYLMHAVQTARIYAGENALWQLKELGISVTEKTTVEELLEVLKPHQWLENDLTKQFLETGILLIQHQKIERPLQTPEGQEAIEEIEAGEEVHSSVDLKDANTSLRETQDVARSQEEPLLDSQAKDAYDQIVKLGYWMRADTDIDNLMEFLQSHGWEDKFETRAFVEKGIDYVEVITPHTEQFGNKDERGIQYLMQDPHTQMQDAIFLPKSMRDLLGVRPGERITIAMGDKTHEVHVQRPRVRDDGTIEGTDSSRLQVSANVLEGLDIPHFTEGIARIDSEKKRLFFESENTEEKIYVKEAKNLMVASEAEGVEDAVFLSEQEQQQLGITPGETIVMKFGAYQRSITIHAASGYTGGWQLSKNLIDEIGLPSELHLRSAFDKKKRELAFSSGVAVLETERTSLVKDQEIKFPETEQLMKRAHEMGSFVVVLDSRRQSMEDLEKGFVRGLIWTGTEYSSVRIPRPEVLYNKRRDVNSGIAAEVKRSIPIKLVDPGAANVVNDKLWFDYGLSVSGLQDYRSEATTLENIQPDQFSSFLTKHNKVIIKPQSASSGFGVFEVEKTEEGTYIVRENIRGSLDAKKGLRETTAATAEEALEIMTTVKAVAGKDRKLAEFMMQEKIDLMEYEYNDPSTGERIVGHPEPRVLVQRGIDAQPMISGAAVRLQNDVSDVPHTMHIMDILHGIHPDDPKMVEKRIQELQQVAVKVLEMAEREACKDPRYTSPQEAGELVVDFGFRKDGTLALIEASPGARTNVYEDYEREHIKNMQDAQYNRMSGPIAYALYRTGMAA